MDEDPGFAERYRAVQSRDPRFDGQFFLAVSSTGIYCRPSCPARTPKPANITFFSTSAAAHEAGYRACKRCLPEAVPGTPEWNLRQDLAGRAMRLIREGVMNDGGVAALSDRLGYSSRHVHRTLCAELGAGPLALARAHRAQTARTLLVTTELSSSEAAFAAGFSSVRQFNATLREVFGSSPGQIRSHRRTRLIGGPARPASSEQRDGAPVHLELDLPVREPFDARGVFRFLAERALTGVESARVEDERLVYGRTLPLAHGPAAVEITATQETSRWKVLLRCELSSLADVPAAVSAARRLLDLDADPAAVDAALAEDPALAALVRQTPGIRLPGTVDPQEYVVRAIVGQQISVAAARTQLTRMASLLGTPHTSSFAGLTTLFPSPAQILSGVPEPAEAGQEDGEPLTPDRPLRLPVRSIRTVRRAAEALCTGGLEVHSGVDPGTLREQLTALSGIGEWTASYLSLRLLGHPDTWMTGDVALLSGAHKLRLLDRSLPRPASHRVLATLAQRWSPWRSYAAMHLWNAAGSTSTGESR